MGTSKATAFMKIFAPINDNRTGIPDRNRASDDFTKIRPRAVDRNDYYKTPIASISKAGYTGVVSRFVMNAGWMIAPLFWWNG